MKNTTLFQVRFRPSVKPPRGFTKSAVYNVTDTRKAQYRIGNIWLPAKDFIKIEIKDAPVFEKTPLRKIASLKPDEVIDCKTDAELMAVLEQAEREGLEMVSGEKPTEYRVIYAPVGIDLNYRGNKGIGHAPLSYYGYNSSTILPASKFVEVAKGIIEELPTGKELIQNHIDAQFEKKPQPELKPFPEGYAIPEGTRVVVLSESRSSISPHYTQIGTKGVTKETDSIPMCLWDNGKSTGMRASELAPLDPREHPEYPEFRKAKDQEAITQEQKEDCKKIDDEIFSNPFSNQGELINENNLLQSKIDTIKRLASIALKHEDYEHMRVILRSIANGEI